MDSSPLGSSIPGIIQARILEQVVFSYSRGIFSTQGWNLHLLWLLNWQADSLPWSHLGSPRIQTIYNKGPSSQGYGFSSGHVWMWELDCEESWVLKNWCFWTVVLEKTLESPLDCKEIQSVHPKGDQSWVFIGRTDAEAETPILWPPHAELTHWKRLWCWEGLQAREEVDDRGWDSWMASLTRCTWVWVNSGSWQWTGMPGVLWFMGCKELDMTEQLNWTDILQNDYLHNIR